MAAVEIDVAPANVTGFAKETVFPAVMLLLRLTVPVPVCVNSSLMLKVALGLIVNGRCL